MNLNSMLYNINRDLEMLIGIFRREKASKAVFTRTAEIKSKAITLSALTSPDVASFDVHADRPHKEINNGRVQAVPPETDRRASARNR